MQTTAPGRIAEVFRTFLVLGLTSFGGPIAHLAMFRRELVAKRAWVDEASYAQLVAFCQFMPGPTSSQVGFLIGYQRAGVLGAFLAWCGFTLPAAVALTTGALLLTSVEGSGLWLWGMKAAVLAVVAQAVLAMIRSLCPDAARASIAVGVAAICLLSPFAWMQVAALIPAGLAGLLLSVKQAPATTAMAIQVPSRCLSLISLGILAVLVFLVITAAQYDLWSGATLSAACFQAGGLVFGGGHVVLPLLREPIVQSHHLITDQVFLTGYGAAQTVPGPLFTVAAWIGAKVGGVPLAARLGPGLHISSWTFVGFGRPTVLQESPVCNLGPAYCFGSECWRIEAPTGLDAPKDRWVEIPETGRACLRLILYTAKQVRFGNQTSRSASEKPAYDRS